MGEKGDLRMVISNEHRQHPGIMNGEKLPDRERSSGIIFFNSSGDECGGLVYDGNEKMPDWFFLWINSGMIRLCNCSIWKIRKITIVNMDYRSGIIQKKRLSMKE